MLCVVFSLFYIVDCDLYVVCSVFCYMFSVVGFVSVWCVLCSELCFCVLLCVFCVVNYVLFCVFSVVLCVVSCVSVLCFVCSLV